MLTEPSPFLSSLEKTSSACARLVPPAPSAFSNSDLLIWPSPLASICENRSFNGSEELVDVELVDEVDEVDEVDAAEAWLCAASSALILSGDICAKPRPPDPVVALALVEVEALLEKSNGLLAPWLKPVDCVDDDFDD